MALDIDAALTALVGKVQTALTGVRPVNAYEADPGGGRSYPAVTAKPGEPFVDYHITMDGAVIRALCVVMVRLEVRVAARPIDSYKAVYAFCSAGTGQTSSIVDAIEADVTLGGVVGDCVVQVAHQPVEDDDDLVVTFDVEIHQRRT